MIKKSILFLCMAIPSFLYGQKKEKEQYNCSTITGIQVDGNLSDWNRSLYNDQSPLWSFASSISEDKLYVIARIRDKELIEEAIRGGIVLNISYSNKKKDGARLVFPKPNLERLEKLYGKPEEQQSWSNEQLLESAIGYSVTGFDKIVNGFLSFDNSYGIRAVCQFNKDGDLVYEAVVPIGLIKFETTDVAIQLAVNTKYAQFKRLQASKKPNAPRPMYSRKQPVKEVVTNPYSESVDVWFNANVK